MAWGRRNRTSAAGETPPFRRMSSPGPGDPRLWVGVGLLVVTTVAGARILGADDDAVTVWRATRDLSAGASAQALQPGLDLEAVTVPRALAAGRYQAPGDDLAGDLRWPIAAGELVPRAALAAPDARPSRDVTVPVDPLHAPAALAVGDRVDVWTSPRESSAPRDPALVLAGARVAAVAADSVGLGGEIAVALSVPAEQVGAVVAAARGGAVDLVAVPPGSQEVSVAPTPERGLAS
jgi:hypothetical protein